MLTPRDYITKLPPKRRPLLTLPEPRHTPPMPAIAPAKREDPPMTRVQASTFQYARRQAIRRLIREQAERDAAKAQGTPPPPLRPPHEFENPLSPQEVEQGERDGTFIAPGEFKPLRRDMQSSGPGGAGRYVTKGTQHGGPGDDDLDDDDTGAAVA